VEGPRYGISESWWSAAAVVADGVGVGTGIGIGVGVGVGTRMEGRLAGRGCVACIVVFLDGSSRNGEWCRDSVAIFRSSGRLTGLLQA